MLIMKAPIELKCAGMSIPNQEAFYHRITDQYEMMSASIGHEDLLHVVTAPPEVYLAEGGMTNIVNSQNIQSRQETKIEIINNLLNRIALTQDVDLTYQDRVYITTMLNKLGIQNVSQFMNQVSRLKQETNHTQQLVSLYWNHIEELSELIEAHQTTELHQEIRTEQTQYHETTNLHEQIMERLQTGAIYQILNNFHTNTRSTEQSVSNLEFNLTEQKRTAVHILLNRLKNVVGEGNVPFVYRHENFYETQNFEELLLTNEAVTNQLTSAVLLNLVDNLYLSQYEKNMKNEQRWVHAEEALYQTAENTFIRMRSEINNQLYRDNRRQMIALTQQMMLERELETVENLLENRQEQVRWLQADEDTKALEQYIANIYEPANILYQQPEMLQEAEEELEERKEILNRWYENIRNHYHTNVNQYVTYLRQSPQQVLQRVEVLYKEAENRGEEAMEQILLELTGETSLNVKNQISQMIHQWQRPSVETEKVMIPDIPEKETRVIFRQENKNQLLTQQYESRYEQIQNQQTQIFAETNISREEQQITREEITDQQTVMVNLEDNVELLEQRLNQINQQNVENYNRYQQLLTQHQTTEKSQPARPVRDMRRDSLLALHNPQELLEELREEPKVQETIRERQLKEITRFLPEDTKRIYERLEEQQAKITDKVQGDIAINRGIQSLMRDIEAVQRENLHVQEQVTERTQTILEHSEIELERWNERNVSVPTVSNRQINEYKDVSIVHKTTENQVNEEMLTELLEQNRLLKNNVTVNREIFENRNTIETKTIQNNTTTTFTEQQNLNEMIQQGVQRQMSAISDQIYSKLERRLQNEKKRRGF